MILVTVGTEKFPFDRLLKIIDEALKNKVIQQEVFAQIGNCNYKPRFFPYQRIIPFDKLIEMIKMSDIVVSHAGTGSIRLCLMLNKTPIVFPREVNFGEHLDSHQMQLAKKMEQLGKAIVARSERELIYSITNYKDLISKQRPPSYPNNIDKIIEYLKKICTTRR